MKRILKIIPSFFTYFLILSIFFGITSSTFTTKAFAVDVSEGQPCDHNVQSTNTNANGAIYQCGITDNLWHLSVAAPGTGDIGVNPCPGGGTGFNSLCTIQADSIGAVISKVIIIILIVAVVIAIIILLIGGIRWILSGGDKAKVEGARNAIIAGIIGLILAFAAFFLISIIGKIFGIDVFNLNIPSLAVTSQ